ncbi:MAG: DUF1003 domain-containing protein [Sphingomonadaceae bacterium]|nr:DUF1003 domain-containing protein [Sphingomonadaceae bacterium]
MSSADPHRLARFLLDRDFDELDPDEQKVIQRVAAGRLAGLDANEKAELTTTFGQRLADRVAAVGGSWGFIIAFGVVLFGWLALNSGVLQLFGVEPFDRYPYIFLNLMLSMLAAIQAPIIMMSQNRQAAKDRIAARHDYEVNLRAQLELSHLSHKMDKLLRHVAAIEAQLNERETP